MNFDLDALRAYAKRVRVDKEDSDSVFSVVGVTFENRQPLINIMSDKTKVRLARERSNEFDFYAVAVEAKLGGKWLKIGYLPKARNKEVAEKLDKAVNIRARVKNINEFFCDSIKETAKGVKVELHEE